MHREIWNNVVTEIAGFVYHAVDGNTQRHCLRILQILDNFLVESGMGVDDIRLPINKRLGGIGRAIGVTGQVLSHIVHLCLLHPGVFGGIGVFTTGDFVLIFSGVFVSSLSSQTET